MQPTPVRSKNISGPMLFHQLFGLTGAGVTSFYFRGSSYIFQTRQDAVEGRQVPLRGVVADQPRRDQRQRSRPAAASQARRRQLRRQGVPVHCRAGPVHDLRTGRTWTHGS